MARRSAGRSSAANDPLNSLLRSMADPAIQAELVRQQNYFQTAAARRWAEYWAQDSAPLTEVEDRRSWHPDPGRGAVTIGGNWARVIVHPRPFVARSRPIWGHGLPTAVQVPWGVMYESPFRVIRCIRRKVRREVMFARGQGGKRGRKGKYHRNADSNIWCK